MRDVYNDYIDNDFLTLADYGMRQRPRVSRQAVFIKLGKGMFDFKDIKVINGILHLHKNAEWPIGKPGRPRKVKNERA